MIIYGTRGITYTKDKGIFHCPACMGRKAYKIKRQRRFFTLYFIPLIPLDLVNEYVECQQCQGTFYTHVIDRDPRVEQLAAMSIFDEALRRVMIDVMLADNVIETAELEAIQKIYAQITDQELSSAALEHEIQAAQADTRAISIYLSDVREQLTDAAKEMIFTAGFLVAASDGVFQDEELAYIGELGSALGLSAEQSQVVLDQLLSGD